MRSPKRDASWSVSETSALRVSWRAASMRVYRFRPPYRWRPVWLKCTAAVWSPAHTLGPDERPGTHRAARLLDGDVVHARPEHDAVVDPRGQWWTAPRDALRARGGAVRLGPAAVAVQRRRRRGRHRLPPRASRWCCSAARRCCGWPGSSRAARLDGRAKPAVVDHVLAGVALQFVNLKAWLLALVISASWIAVDGEWAERVAIVLPLMAAYAFASNFVYALVGSLLRRWLAHGQRLLWFNRAMAGVARRPPRGGCCGRSRRVKPRARERPHGPRPLARPARGRDLLADAADDALAVGPAADPQLPPAS